MARAPWLLIILAALATLQSCQTASHPGADWNTPFVERFRLGWYDDTGKLDTPRELSARGFDFVVPYVGFGDPERVGRFLDAASEAGIGVYLEIPQAIALSSGDDLERYVGLHGKHPNVLGWYLYDEPEWRPVSRPAALRKAYARIKAVDPARPVSLAFMFTGLISPYRASMDRLWFDYYPFAAGSPEFAAIRGGAYARKTLAAAKVSAAIRKPLTLILQGYGERGGKPQFGRRLPTAREARYQLYASLLARPESLTYWVWYRTDKGWVDSVLVPLLSDFRSRFPVGIGYASARDFKVEGLVSDRILLSNESGKSWLLVLSREATGREASVALPPGWAFGTAEEREAIVWIEPFDARLIEVYPH